MPDSSIAVGMISAILTLFGKELISGQLAPLLRGALGRAMRTTKLADLSELPALLASGRLAHGDDVSGTAVFSLRVPGETPTTLQVQNMVGAMLQGTMPTQLCGMTSLPPLGRHRIARLYPANTDGLHRPFNGLMPPDRAGVMVVLSEGAWVGMEEKHVHFRGRIVVPTKEMLESAAETFPLESYDAALRAGGLHFLSLLDTDASLGVIYSGHPHHFYGAEIAQFSLNLDQFRQAGVTPEMVDKAVQARLDQVFATWGAPAPRGMREQVKGGALWFDGGIQVDRHPWAAITLTCNTDLKSERRVQVDKEFAELTDMLARVGSDVLGGEVRPDLNLVPGWTHPGATVLGSQEAELAARDSRLLAGVRAWLRSEEAKKT